MGRDFRANKTSLLIATDVASRGLDIPNIRTVLSYNAACNIETHTHRIGRTGRAGEKGVAITLLTTKEKKLAAHLVEQLETQQQKVPNELMGVALSCKNFQIARGKGGLMSTGAKNTVDAKCGLGFEGAGKSDPKKKKNLSNDINKMADYEFERNKLAQSGGQADPRKAITGFVAACEDNSSAAVKSTEVGSDSDDDLYAPGVTPDVANRVPYARPLNAMQGVSGFAPQPNATFAPANAMQGAGFAAPSQAALAAMQCAQESVANAVSRGSRSPKRRKSRSRRKSRTPKRQRSSKRQRSVKRRK